MFLRTDWEVFDKKLSSDESVVPIPAFEMRLDDDEDDKMMNNAD